ncbi:hypothetical protein [uncultured Algibacter sp.]|uniref:hypothetical protein n=1 Tax=uncultured Algibacter sp. TaxID=298659 RepID=UPI002635EBC0|nr:hypothetical protein [uncultured Algibacter sp.]
MRLTDQHKALLITFLISGTVILSVFNLSLIQKDDISSESYYEMEPEKELTEEDVKLLEALEKLNNSKAETNKAFNESQEEQHFAQAFKKIAPPEDYVPPTSTSGSENSSIPNKKFDSTESKLNEEELSKFSKVNELLKEKRSENNNARSSISFSLKNRKKIYLPIPVYLCEVNGKIVVNIEVNSRGDVTNTYINSASTSNNECLIERALEYAKQSQFSPDYSKEEQLGTITFLFIGKR